MEKVFNLKNFPYFFWTPLGSRVRIKINFFFNFILSCQQSDNCSHCLPPVSFTGVIDTGGNLPLPLLTPVANLPPVSLIPVVHLDSRISPRIFEKIRNGLNGILLGWGETDS
jgi:hypothetical protein